MHKNMRPKRTTLFFKVNKKSPKALFQTVRKVLLGVIRGPKPPHFNPVGKGDMRGRSPHRSGFSGRCKNYPLVFAAGKALACPSKNMVF
jgi:hypothetical protein